MTVRAAIAIPASAPADIELDPQVFDNVVGSWMDGVAVARVVMAFVLEDSTAAGFDTSSIVEPASSGIEGSSKFMKSRTVGSLSLKSFELGSCSIVDKIGICSSGTYAIARVVT